MTMDISGMDVSHLCHNRLRMLKDHLSVEPQAVNCSRVACCNRNTYQGHGGIYTMPPTFKIISKIVYTIIIVINIKQKQRLIYIM